MLSSYEIIEKVKRYPALWQPTHPFFSNRACRARTWTKVAKDLNTSDVNAIKKRWKHLKDTYRKEVKRLVTNQITTSSWTYFTDLEFLTTDTGYQEEPKPAEKDAEESEVGEEKAQSSEPASEPEEPVEPQTRETKSSKKSRLSEPVISKPRVEPKSQTLVKFRKIMRSLTKLSHSIENTPTDRNLKNDTDYMFLVSLLPTMKKFSDVQRLHFRSKINHWLMNALVENEQLCDSKELVQAQINEMNKFTMPSKIMYCTALRDALTQ